jgi:hypothetical protein
MLHSVPQLLHDSVHNSCYNTGGSLPLSMSLPQHMID